MGMKEGASPSPQKKTIYLFCLDLGYEYIWTANVRQPSIRIYSLFSNVSIALFFLYCVLFYLCVFLLQLYSTYCFELSHLCMKLKLAIILGAPQANICGICAGEAVEVESIEVEASGRPSLGVLDKSGSAETNCGCVSSERRDLQKWVWALVRKVLKGGMKV